MKKTGFYIIKDKFFEDMPDPYLKGNKAGNRPHYYCFEDTNTGIYWMIPLSSRIDKYKGIVEKKAKAGKPCDIIHIVKLDDSRESAFLIQDMFPITEEIILCHVMKKIYIWSIKRDNMKRAWTTISWHMI